MALAVPAFAAGVVVKVNGQAISDVQVSQRAALKALEHSGGQKQAVDELINEALENQEAARLGLTVSESDIDDALLNVARSLKMSQSNLEKVLTDNGVAVQTLRDRLKATLAWQKVSGAVISQKVQFSEADIDAQAKAKLNATNSYDYILKEVLFLLPASGGSASKRTAEANAYRKAFTGCKNAVQLSLNYTDAAVRDIGRRNANQFPDAIAQELAKLNVGGITTPRVVQGGVSMLAVCSKEASQDTTYIANQLRQNQGDQAVKTAAAKYLADLKAKAQIVYG
jgi:peptidyl-prolyl cis-trans isomerase SurA